MRFTKKKIIYNKFLPISKNIFKLHFSIRQFSCQARIVFNETIWYLIILIKELNQQLVKV